jgi:hypothetical protein
MVTSLVNISIINYFVVLFIIEMQKFYINWKICFKISIVTSFFYLETKRFFKNNYLNRRKITGIVKVEPRLRCRAQISSRYREENPSWREGGGGGGGGRNQKSLKNIHPWKLAMKNLEYCYCNFFGTHCIIKDKFSILMKIRGAPGEWGSPGTLWKEILTMGAQPLSTACTWAREIKPQISHV